MPKKPNNNDPRDATEAHSRAERTQRAVQKALSRLEPTRRAAVEKLLPGIPPLYVPNYIRAVEGLASPRGATKSHCLECMGWVRDEVKNCTGYACPLFAYRPFQGDDADEEDGE